MSDLPVGEGLVRRVRRRTVSTDLLGGARPRGCEPAAGHALKRHLGHCVLRPLRDGSGCAARRQPARAGLAASASPGGGSEHRTAPGLLHGDFDLYEAGDVGDHAIQAATLGGDAHELSFSEGLQHLLEPTPWRVDV